MTVRDGSVTLNKVNIQKCSEKQINAVLSAFGLPLIKLMPKDPKDVEIDTLKKRIAELEKISLTKGGDSTKDKIKETTKKEDEVEAIIDEFFRRNGIIRVVRA